MQIIFRSRTSGLIKLFNRMNRV